VVLSTSGSTGMPMRIYRGLDACKRSWAAAWAHNRPGVEPGDRCASFTGAEIVPPGQARPPYWRMNRPGNTRLYSVFHLGPAQLGNYAEDLLRFDPVWIYAYPSALSILAGYFLDRGLEPPPSLRTIVTSSEQLLPEFRERIEAAFGLAVTDEYGQGEMGAMGATCRRCGRMHLLGTYSHVEFLDAGRRSDRGAVREIVCTSFVNPCWPMIRYRVGDMAVLEEDNDCPLAQGGPSIREIHGRTAHVLWDREDRPIPFLSVKGCRNLRAVQAVQQTPGEVLLRVVPTEEYSRRADEPILLEKLRRRLGDESRMRVEVEYLAEIPRTASGKFLMIVSKVPPEKRPGG
jgi:phenylacetate-CoA ligase